MIAKEKTNHRKMNEAEGAGARTAKDSLPFPTNSRSPISGETAAKEISPSSPARRLLTYVLGAAALTIVFAWSYWPTLNNLLDAWNQIPDYSHGFLVVPFALIFLWAKRDQCPGLGQGFAWGGLLLLGSSFVLRYLGAQFFLGSVDAWSMVFWLAGATWFLGGKSLFRWALPAIGFLFFMIPLPYGMERWLSLPLQRMATAISCWVLQCLGQPAIAEGNTIWISNHILEVEQACSGLRIFVGILALAYAYLLFIRRSWWERIFLILSVIPISLTANSARIVVTAMLYQFASSEAAARFTHDFAGWVMIPFAAGLFALVLWYVRALVREEEEVDLRSIIRLDRLS